MNSPYLLGKRHSVNKLGLDYIGDLDITLALEVQSLVGLAKIR